jgi:hypothetical protein
VGMRVIFAHQRQRRAREAQEVAEELQYGAITLESPIGIDGVITATNTVPTSSAINAVTASRR